MTAREDKRIRLFRSEIKCATELLYHGRAIAMFTDEAWENGGEYALREWVQSAVDAQPWEVRLEILASRDGLPLELT